MPLTHRTSPSATTTVRRGLRALAALVPGTSAPLVARLSLAPVVRALSTAGNSSHPGAGAPASFPSRAVAGWVRVGGASIGRRAGLLVACVVSLGVVGAPAAHATKYVDRVIGTEDFGTTGGLFFAPQDVAVNSTGAGGVAPGTFYVADGYNYRVQRFAPSGAFERAWGADADLPAGGTDLEACTVAANCKGGEPSGGNGTSAGNGGLSPAWGVTVDGDTGNVYVVSPDANRVDVYDADGTFLRAFGFDVVAGNAEFGYEVCVQTNGDICQTGAPGTETGQVGGTYFAGPRLAVSPSDGNPSTGKVYLSNPGNQRVEAYDLDGANPSNFGTGTFPQFYPRDIAVDGEIVYVSTTINQNQVERYDIDTETFLAPIDVTALASDIDSSQDTLGLDIDPDSGNLLIARNNREAGIVEIGSPATVPTFADRHVADSFLGSVTANSVSDEIIAIAGNRILFFNDGPTPADATIGGVTEITATGATLHAVVDSSGSLPTDYELQVSRNGVVWTTAAGGTVAAGDSETITAPIDGLLPNTSYRVRMVANRTLGNPDLVSAESTFLTDAVKPEIVTSGADSVEDTSLRLFAYVNPNSTPTSYRFEWGTQPGSYPNRVPVPNQSLGSGPNPVLAAEKITGLQAGKTYYYRLVAVSASEGTTTGPERTVKTRATPLPARDAELVSPNVKSAGGVVQSYLFAVEQDFQIADDGNSVFYLFSHGVPDATTGGDLRYKATRGENSWSSVQMTPTLSVQSNPGFPGVYAGRYQYLAPDLSCGVVKSAQPLTPDASTVVVDRNGANLFRRNNDGSYDLLAPEPSNAATLTLDNAATEVDLGYGVRGASPDCQRVVFESKYRFDGANDSGLYISKEGVIENVGILPDGSSASNAGVGSSRTSPSVDEGTAWRSVSENTSHVYFTADSNDGDDAGNRALYLWRDGEQTVKVSASETATANRRAFYQTAATDGSKVAFLANYGLTADSSTGPDGSNCRPGAVPAPCALYVYDAESGDLTDISASDDPANTNGATVAGVIGASDDMSRIYFAARGQLVAGKGRTYSENVADDTYNVYLSDDGDLTYIAGVKSEDVASGNLSNLITVPELPSGGWTAQVNPAGTALVFMSRDNNVVGYDSGGEGEFYRFSAETGETICMSCRPDGSPAVPRGAGIGNWPFDLRNRPTIPHRARMLSNDGRRFVFEFADALTPGAVDGNENIYVWDDGTLRLLHTEPSAPEDEREAWADLVGLDASGNNVFLATSAGLVPTDTDGVKDLYALRVGGGFANPPTFKPPCDPLASGCQGGGSSAIDAAIETVQPGGLNPFAPVRGAFSVKKFSKAQLASLLAGRSVDLAVKVNQPGKVTVTGEATIARKRRRVVSSSRSASRSGTVKVPVGLSASGRKELARAGKLTVSLAVRFSKAKEAVVSTVSLKTVKPKARRSTRQSTNSRGGVR
jgi:hypothetical protein